MELLLPARNLEILKKTINYKPDAFYLGMKDFSARAYTDNFSFEELEEAVQICHLRNIKIYVAMNILIYNDELEKVYQYITDLNKLNIDAIICADLSIADFIKQNFKDIEVHISTQTGIDDLNGVKFMEKQGYNRIVISRETNIDTINDIKKSSSIQIESFVHGALCISYSGNCLFSTMLGMRFGNRGRCVGVCRNYFSLVDEQDTILDKGYLLNLKDLNTLKYLKNFKNIDSLKVEGRMRNLEYVLNVCNEYRKTIDNDFAIKEETDNNLYKTFNRDYTKGYINHENVTNMVNRNKSNHNGLYIGKVIKRVQNKVYFHIENDCLNQNDSINIRSNDLDVNLTVTKIYNNHNKIINSVKTNETGIILLSENVHINDLIYKTNDFYLNKNLLSNNTANYHKKILINIELKICRNKEILLLASFDDTVCSVAGSILEESFHAVDTSKIKEQLNKFTDSPYMCNLIDIHIEENFNPFIRIKELNELRRTLILELNKKTLKKNFIPITNLNEHYLENILEKSNSTNKISCHCSTIKQKMICEKLMVDYIYYENYIPRNNAHYNTTDFSKNYILVGGYNGINYLNENYINKEIITDFSLNVTNSKTIHLLLKENVKRITLSIEHNLKSIQSIINTVNFNTVELEMVTYGHIQLMHTKYCLLKKQNLCKQCKDKTYYLKDKISSFPLKQNKDCSTSILNSKRLNLIDDLFLLKDIHVFRLNFTIEDELETENVIKVYQNKIKNLKTSTNYFDEKKDTRGVFNKQID